MGVALVVFGLLFAAATALGRAWAGLFYASRYNTFYLLLLAGCYLAFFERPDVRVGESGLEKGPTSTRLGRRPKPVIALVVVALLVCVEVVSSPQQGIDEARTWRASQVQDAVITLHINRVSDSTINAARLYPGTSPSFLRMLASEAAARRLSLFGTAPPVDVFTWHGSTRLVKPTPNAVLRGRVLLEAGSNAIGLTGLTFRLSGGALAHPEIIARGITLPFVSAAWWDSTTVPDGSYTLQAVAHSSLGPSFTSPGISVRVAN